MLLVVVWALAGCSVFETGTTRHLALVGDSITDQTRATFDDELGDDWLIEIDAVPGLRIAEQQAALEDLVAEEPDAIVVNLGTNDVLNGHPLEASFEDMAAMLDAASQVPCSFTVTVNEHIFQLGRDDGWNDASIALNVEMRAMAEERGVGIIDWSAEVGRQLEAGEPDGPVTTDTVHPTDLGQDLLIGLYEDALDTC